MKSLTKLFRFGPGPSSSHTIAPSLAAHSFGSFLKNKGLKPTLIKGTLYGSLALTGKGHGTDEAIRKALKGNKLYFVFDSSTPVANPLSFTLTALDSSSSVMLERHYISIGGGEVTSPDDPALLEKDIYPFRDLSAVKSYMAKNHLKDFKSFCLRYEDPSIDDYLLEAVKRMFSSLEKGLTKSSYLPSGLNPRLRWKRSAGSINLKANGIKDESDKREMLITSYAYAVAESSAAGEEIVTAPTCGSSGVLPAVLYYAYKNLGVSIERIRDSLYVSGVIGNIVKQNASIAGAIGGCQAEIGTASSMGAAALSYLFGSGSLYEIEYAAECAMEHFLGLSCDPVDGYVIIPCIERNGMGALRSLEAYLYSKYVSGVRKNEVSFDNVVMAMKLTGDSLASAYKETAEGGLAAILKKQKSPQ